MPQPADTTHTTESLHPTGSRHRAVAAAGDPGSPGDPETRVAEVVDALVALEDRPVAEHAAGYESAHEQLRGLLG